jgi:hypothetical protein
MAVHFVVDPHRCAPPAVYRSGVVDVFVGAVDADHAETVSVRPRDLWQCGACGCRHVLTRLGEWSGSRWHRLIAYVSGGDRDLFVGPSVPQGPIAQVIEISHESARRMR